jgi:hypothetical protein
LNPPDGVMMIPDVTERPCFTVPLDGARLMLKSTATAAVIITVTADELLAAKVVQPLGQRDSGQDRSRQTQLNPSIYVHQATRCPALPEIFTECPFIAKKTLVQ